MKDRHTTRTMALLMVLSLLIAGIGFAGGTDEQGAVQPVQYRGNGFFPGMGGYHGSMGQQGLWQNQDLELVEYEGVLITGIIQDTPAHQAGLQRGDIILSIQGTAVNSRQDIDQALADLEAGQTVALEIQRGTASLTKNLTIETRLFRPYIGILTQNSQPGMFGRMFFGDEVVPWDGTAAGTLGAVIVAVQPDSPAQKAGLTPGMLISEINGEPLASADVAGIISELEPGDSVSLTVQSLLQSSDSQEITVTLGSEDGRPYLGIQYHPFPNLGMSRAFGNARTGPMGFFQERGFGTPDTPRGPSRGRR